MSTDDPPTWCDELNQVRGTMSQLQATLSQLFAKSPSLAKYKELLQTFGSEIPLTRTWQDKLRHSLMLPQVKVAVRMKYLYSKGYMPFFARLSKINFRLPNVDKYVAELLNFNPQTWRHENEGRDYEPSMDYPPLLPVIDDSLLLKLVLTDKSLRQPSDFLELEHEDGSHDFHNNHNGKTAMVGKSILDLALVRILDEAFPKAHEDDIQYLKRRLSKSHVLAKLAFAYGIPEMGRHLVPKDSSTEEKAKVFERYFLAYVGGMSKDGYSLSQIEQWLSDLYRPIVKELYEECQDTDKLRDVFKVAHAEFGFLMLSVTNIFAHPTKQIDYEYATVAEEPFAVELRVDGMKLGIGLGSTLEGARGKAAFNTLSSSDMKTRLLRYLLDNYRTPEQKARDEQETLQENEEVASEEPKASPMPSSVKATKRPLINVPQLPYTTPKPPSSPSPETLLHVPHQGQLPAQPSLQGHMMPPQKQMQGSPGLPLPTSLVQLPATPKIRGTLPTPPAAQVPSALRQAPLTLPQVPWQSGVMPPIPQVSMANIPSIPTAPAPSHTSSVPPQRQPLQYGLLPSVPKGKKRPQ